VTQLAGGGPFLEGNFGDNYGLHPLGGNFRSGWFCKRARALLQSAEQLIQFFDILARESRFDLACKLQFSVPFNAHMIEVGFFVNPQMTSSAR
jgi:hypothetical protein